jgi:hypothetical protein
MHMLNIIHTTNRRISVSRVLSEYARCHDDRIGSLEGSSYGSWYERDLVYRTSNIPVRWLDWHRRDWFWWWSGPRVAYPDSCHRTWWRWCIFARHTASAQQNKNLNKWLFIVNLTTFMISTKDEIYYRRCHEPFEVPRWHQSTCACRYHHRSPIPN